MTKVNPQNIWDAIATCAVPLSVSPLTVAQWKSRGYVPPSLHYDLAQTALDLGVSLTHKQLHEMWKAAKKIDHQN